MKKLIQSTTLVLGFMALLLAADAQNINDRWSLGFGYVARDFHGLPDFKASNSDLIGAYSLNLGRYVGKNLDLGLQGSFTPFPIAKQLPYEDFLDLGAILRLKLANGDYAGPKAALVPFLQTGFKATFARQENGNDFYLPAGLGLKIQTGSPVSVDLGALYNIGLGDFTDFVSFGGGINFAFGGGKVEEPEVLPEPVDTDGDGIVDEDDECPTESGLAQFNGCPDKDGDGVADKDDNCPEVAGLITLKGCPEEVKDSDGDGIPDEEDKCPNVAGLVTFDGCPDTDGDGIMDKEDDCPNTAGDAAFNGCPDTDGDGIRDKDDRCPDVAGVAEMQGCPAVEEEVKEALANITKNVQFETGSAILKESSKPVLDEIVSLMAKYPEYSLKIDGHTDSQGQDNMNMTLSQDRASACKNYLEEKGVNPDRMVATGYGETQPIADNNTRAGRAENRRVAFELFVK